MSNLITILNRVHLQSEVAYVTTGFRHFAECQKHSAKPIMHSAKALLSAALGKGHSANKVMAKTTLPSAFFEHSAKVLPREKKSLGEIKIDGQRKVSHFLMSRRGACILFSPPELKCQPAPEQC